MADITKLTSSDGVSHNLRDLGALAEVSKVNDTLVITDRSGSSTQLNLDGYTIETQAVPESGYSATYQLKKNGTAVGSKINISDGAVLTSVTLNTVVYDDTPVEGYLVGEQFLDFSLNNAGVVSHIYTNLGGINTGGGGGGSMNVLRVNNGIIELATTIIPVNANEVQY